MIGYVLVGQGMEIYRTKRKEEATEIMKESNQEWYEYCQRCYDNHKPCADNEVFMFEEEME